MAGIGGQFDFVLGASRSAGGVSIIALPSTGRDGAVSRIVPRLAAGAAVTTPRYLADWVVTEHGAARLRGLSDAARATALIAVAHPRFQGELERAAYFLAASILREDLLVGREAVRRLVGVDASSPSMETSKMPPTPSFRAGGDAVLALDGGLQTGGLGEVVSLPAVQDLDVHGSSLPPGMDCDNHCI